jgi:hypothetical protein
MICPRLVARELTAPADGGGPGMVDRGRPHALCPRRRGAHPCCWHHHGARRQSLPARALPRHLRRPLYPRHRRSGLDLRPPGQMDLTHISVTKKRAPSLWTIWSPSRACACRLTRRRAAAPAESLVHSSNSVYRVRVPDLWRRRLKRYADVGARTVASQPRNSSARKSARASNEWIGVI